MRLLAARTLAWALLMGGWLVLGTLGHARLPLWAGGLAPVALWLGSAGFGLYFSSSSSWSAARLRSMVLLSGTAAAAALAWATHDTSPAAIGLASVSWGILLVAASRAVRMMRPFSHRLPPPVAPAAAGAALAWTIAGDPSVEATSATALWLVAMAALLAALLPRGATGRGCRAGLFDCALPPATWAQWSDPGTWAAQSARWAMLPMMASLAVMTQWCGSDWGLTPSQAAGLHLGAMLLPPLALHHFRVRLRTDSGVAAAMAAGLAMVCWLPGLQGLMAASLCHSLAWGLAWFGGVSAQPAACRPTPASAWIGALAPACCVGAIGVAIGDNGPSALRWLHAGLGMLATAGTVASLWRPASFELEKSP